jgi:hypothetical protein
MSNISFYFTVDVLQLPGGPLLNAVADVC